MSPNSTGDSPATLETPGSTGKGPRHPILAVASIVLLTEVFAFEFYVVQPGLKDIAVAFGTTHVSLTMTIVALVSAVVVPLMAKWGDLHGKKLTLMLASVLFAIGTVLCILTSSYAVFLIGRALEGAGLVVTVIAYGLIRDLLPPRWVPIGIGGLGTGYGVSAIAGPIIGGALIDSFGIDSVFWFMLIYIIVTAGAVQVLVPESPVRLKQKLDLPGATLLGLGVGALVYAGTFSAGRFAAAVLGIGFLVLFVVVERRASQPLISMSLLARPAMAMTLLTSVAVGFVIGAQNVLLPLMLRTPTIPGAIEDGLGLSALGYGLNYALPMGICAAACGFLAGYVSRRVGPRVAALVSALGWTVGCVLVAAGFVTGSWQVVVVALPMGIGLGFYYASTANLIIEAVPATVQGISASMKFAVESGSGAIAGAVAGTIIATDVVTTLPSGTVIHGMDGFRLAFLILAVIGAVGCTVILLMRHGRTPATGGIAPGER